jgi:hypothetical protein
MPSAAPEASLLPGPAIAAASQTARRDRLIRLLRIAQSTLTASLSVAIAVLQLRVYAYYDATQAQPDLYPAHLDLLPTLLLLAVALAALVFDAAQLVCFLLPGRGVAVRVARLVAAKAHYVVVAAKAASFFFSAVVAKNAGRGQGNNLWSWACDGKGQGVGGLCASQVRSLIRSFFSSMSATSRGSESDWRNS